MAELQFDAVLIDQITPKLEEIATALNSLADLATTVSGAVQGAFDDMAVAAGDFLKQVEDTQAGVEASFAGMGSSIDLFTQSLVDAAAPMEAFNEQLVLFTDEASANFVSGLTADTDALSAFVDSTVAADEAITAESDILVGLASQFGTIIDVKVAASSAEDALAASSRGATLALSAEASASASASVNISKEADAGLKSKASREGGYGAVLGATMMLGLAGAMARVGINMVKSGMESQAAMARILALADTSSTHFQQYKDTIEAWSVSLGASISDLSNGLYDIVSVGYKAGDALTILHAAAMAAASGQVDLHTVTNGLTSILKVYGLQASDATLATDILITGVREGKAPFDQFSKAIGLVGVASEQAHFQIGESAAALATLTAVWPSVRQAGQNLQNLIQTVGINMDALAKHAKKAGVAFDEQKYSAMNLQERLQYLWDISGHNAQVFREIVGNATAAKAGYYLAADGAAQFTQNLEGMGNAAGATADAFNVHKQTLLFAMQQIHAAISVISMDFAELVQPIVIGAMRLLTDIFQGLADAIEHHANIMTPLIIMLAFAIAGLLVGSLVALSEVLAPAMAAAAGIAFTFAGVSMALGALIAWFVRAYNTSPALRDAIQQLGQAFGQLWLGIQPLVQDVLSTLVDWLKQAAAWLGLTSQGADKTGKSAQGAQGAVGILVGIIRGLTGAVKDLANWLAPVDRQLSNLSVTIIHGGQHLRDFRDNITSTKQPILDQAQQARNLGGAHKQLGDILKGLGGIFLALATTAAGILPFFIFGQSAIFRFSGSVIRTTQAMGGGFMPAIRGVATAIMNLAEGGLKLLTNLFLGQIPILENIRTALAFVRGFFTSLLSDGVDGLITGLMGLLDAWQAILPAIGGFLAASIPVVGVILLIVAAVVGVVLAFQHWWTTSAQFRAAMGEVLHQIVGVWTFLQSQFQPVWQSLVKTFQTQVVPILHSLQATWEAIKPALLAIGVIIIAVVIVALGEFIALVKAVIAALAPLIGGVFTALVGAFKFVIGIVQLVITIVGGLISIIVDLIFNQKNLGNDLKNIWQGIKDSLGNIIGGLWDMIQGIFGGAIRAILAFIGTFIGSILDFFGHLFEKLVGHSIVPDMIKGIIEWFLKLPIEILEMVGQFVLKLITTFLELAARILTTIASFVIMLVAYWRALGTMILAAVVGFIEHVVHTFINLGVRILLTIAAFVLAVVAYWRALGAMILATIIAFVENAVTNFINLGVRILDAVANFVVMVIAYWNLLTSAVLAAIQAWVSRVVNFFIDLGTSIINTIISFVLHVVDEFVMLGLRVLAAIELLKTRGIQVFNEYKALVIGIVVGFINNIVQHFTDLKNSLGTAVQNALNFVRDKFNSFISGALSFGQKLIDQVAQGIKNAIPNLISSVSNGLQKVRNLFPSSPAKEGPLQTAPNWGGTLMNQVTDGITNNTSKVVTAAKNVAGQLATTLTGVQGTVGIGVGSASALGAGGVPPQLGSAGAKGGNIQHQEIHVHLDGGVGTGLSMINATDRAKIVQDIAVEMARQMRLQGRVGTGYSGG